MTRELPDVERVSVGALVLADVGAGLYLIDAGVDAGQLAHVVVGVVALLLALPGVVVAATGRWPYVGAADGLLVNVGALVFVTLDVVLATSGDVVRAVGLGLVLTAATVATAALYVRVARGGRR
jgi:hypothetical protein